MTDNELLAALKALPRSGLGVPHGRAWIRRPDHDLALMVRLDAFVDANGGEIVTVQLPESKGLRPGRIFRAARATDRLYDVPSELVDS